MNGSPRFQTPSRKFLACCPDRLFSNVMVVGGEWCRLKITRERTHAIHPAGRCERIRLADADQGRAAPLAGGYKAYMEAMTKAALRSVPGGTGRLAHQRLSVNSRSVAVDRGSAKDNRRLPRTASPRVGKRGVEGDGRWVGGSRNLCGDPSGSR